MTLGKRFLTKYKLCNALVANGIFIIIAIVKNKVNGNNSFILIMISFT